MERLKNINLAVTIFFQPNLFIRTKSRQFSRRNGLIYFISPRATACIQCCEPNHSLSGVNFSPACMHLVEGVGGERVTRGQTRSRRVVAKCCFKRKGVGRQKKPTQ